MSSYLNRPSDASLTRASRQVDEQTNRRSDEQDFHDPQELQEHHYSGLGEVSTISTEWYYRGAENGTGEGGRQESEEQERLFATGRYTAMAPAAFITLAARRGEQSARPDFGKSAGWEFCRLLKAHPEFATLDGEQVIKKIPWHLTRFTLDDQLDILDEWDLVTFAAGEGPLQSAAAMAKEYPLENPPGPDHPLYRNFISLAGWLQVLRGNKPIQLPVQRLAPILKTTDRRVSKLRRQAIKHGLLRVVKAANWATGKATSFRFTVDKFPELRRRQ